MNFVGIPQLRFAADVALARARTTQLKPGTLGRQGIQDRPGRACQNDRKQQRPSGANRQQAEPVAERVGTERRRSPLTSLEALDRPPQTLHLSHGRIYVVYVEVEMDWRPMALVGPSARPRSGCIRSPFLERKVQRRPPHQKRVVGRLLLVDRTPERVTVERRRSFQVRNIDAD